MPNTKQEWDVPSPPDGDTSPTDNVAAKLESDLQRERDSKREERFYWILSLVIVLNVTFFDALSNKWAIIPIFLLEVVGLIGLADWLGVDRVKVLLEKIYSRWLNK